MSVLMMRRRGLLGAFRADGKLPVITSQPVSVSVENGTYATFSVTATGSDLSYQWQYRRINETGWSDWTGKTTNSIRFRGVATNNGNQYRCVVSNADGSVVSDPATLTVIGE